MRLSIDGESRPVYRPATQFRPTNCQAAAPDRWTACRCSMRWTTSIDIVRLPATSSRSPSPGLVGGIALVDDMQIEVIDAHWVFSTMAGVPPATRAPGVPPDRPGRSWTRNILAPLVAAAGYRPILFDGDFDDDAGRLPRLHRRRRRCARCRPACSGRDHSAERFDRQRQRRQRHHLPLRPGGIARPPDRQASKGALRA